MARSKVKENIDRFNEMSPEEQKLYLDFVAPEPEPEAPAKKSRKPRTTRTPRMAGLPKPGSETPKAGASNGALCIAIIPGLNVPCNDPEDALIHDPNGGYGGYHPFQPVVPVAAKRSGRKSASTSSTASSETSKETVSAVGVSAGD